MPTPTELHARRSIPVDQHVAYDAVLPMPLPRIFSRRYLALPPIREVHDQAGGWGTVGQTRTIVLADRGTMRETLTSVTPGTSFGYDIEPRGRATRGRRSRRSSRPCSLRAADVTQPRIAPPERP